jgi:hypothetical protein
LDCKFFAAAEIGGKFLLLHRIDPLSEESLNLIKSADKDPDTIIFDNKMRRRTSSTGSNSNFNSGTMENPPKSPSPTTTTTSDQ